jgi:hypothetical protein
MGPEIVKAVHQLLEGPANQDRVTIETSLREGFAELLDDPLGSRVSSHIEVQDGAPSVLDNEQAVE